MRLIGILATAFALTACGAVNHETKSNKPSDESAKATGATLPAVTLIRGPVVGTDRKEMNDKAEMRLSNDQNISTENVESTFASSQAPDKIVKTDELDKTTSTESFCGYRWGGYGYGGYNWGFYRPMYYNYGYYYNWNYANMYPWGGYNYYRYNSAFGYGYSGYGW